MDIGKIVNENANISFSKLIFEMTEIPLARNLQLMDKNSMNNSCNSLNKLGNIAYLDINLEREESGENERKKKWVFIVFCVLLVLLFIVFV